MTAPSETTGTLCPAETRFLLGDLNSSEAYDQDMKEVRRGAVRLYRRSTESINQATSQNALSKRKTVNKKGT